MRFYFGGAGNGQEQLAQHECDCKPKRCTPEEALCAPAIADFHLVIYEVLKAGDDAQVFTKHLIEQNPDAVVVSDEIGLGIVPIDPFERRWREETGRALCLLAAQASHVTRVYCGIPRRLK